MRGFKTFDDAIEQPPASYGLAAYCFTENGRRALLLGACHRERDDRHHTTMIARADSPFGA